MRHEALKVEEVAKHGSAALEYVVVKLQKGKTDTFDAFKSITRRGLPTLGFVTLRRYFSANSRS